MAGRRYEDRITVGGIAVAGQPRYADQAGPVPVLPPLTAARAAGAAAGHEPLSIVHVHEHGDGHGRSHSHLHSHANDSSHSPGDGHPHTPGNPDSGMPSAQLNSASPDPGDEMRDDVSGIGLAEQITRFLEGQGVDVDQALADLGHEQAHQKARTRARADRAVALARQLKAAKRALAFEQNGYLEHAPGFGIAKVGEASERVSQLEALAEACVNDPELIREARARAAR